MYTKLHCKKFRCLKDSGLFIISKLHNISHIDVDPNQLITALSNKQKWLCNTTLKMVHFGKDFLDDNFAREGLLTEKQSCKKQHIPKIIFFRSVQSLRGFM